MDAVNTSGFYGADFSNLEWRDARDKCNNVRKLNLFWCMVEHFKAIFASPKQYLKKLKIWVSQPTDTEDVKALMDNISKGTVLVEKLTYSVPPLYDDICDKFFEKNRNSIRSIFYHQIYDEGDDNLDDLLQEFLKLLVRQQQLSLDCKSLRKTKEPFREGVFTSAAVNILPACSNETVIFRAT